MLSMSLALSMVVTCCSRAYCAFPQAFAYFLVIVSQVLTSDCDVGM